MRQPKDVKIGNFTLEEILERHKHWLKEDCVGYENMRADLSDADLSYVELMNIDLSGANLERANLSHANLRGAILYRVNLYDAVLIYTDLSFACLYCANLHGSDLFKANLFKTNLIGANLCFASLWKAILKDTKLEHTNLHSVNLRDAKGSNIEYRKGKILTESIVGYKKCKDNTIVTLEIPRGAIVFSVNGDECRTNKAKVVEIEGHNRAYSRFKYMSYYVGDEITVYDFNCEYNIECGAGIHFFTTRKEAENYPQ